MSHRQWLQLLVVCLFSMLQLGLASHICAHDRACYAAVTSANGTPTLAASQCQSYFSYTVSPCPTTVTSTKVVGTALPPTTVTSYSTRTHYTVVVDATTYESSYFLATILDKITYTESYDVYVTTYTPTTVYTLETVTLTTATYLPGQQQPMTSAVMRREPIRNAAPRAATCLPSTIRPPHTPRYLKTACKSEAVYSSACACLGVTPATTTLPQKTETTITRRSTTQQVTVTATGTKIVTVTFDHTALDYIYTATKTTTAHEVFATFVPITVTKTLPSTTTSTLYTTVFTATTCSTVELHATGGSYPGAFFEIEAGADEAYLDDVVYDGPRLTLLPQPDGTFHLYSAADDTYAGTTYNNVFDYFRFDPLSQGLVTPLECVIDDSNILTCGLPGALQYAFYTCDYPYPAIFVVAPGADPNQVLYCKPFGMVAEAACYY